MKTQLRNRVLMLAIGVSALAFSANTAQAQVESVNATVTVQNSLTTAVVDNMDFGTIASIAGGGNTASAILNPVTDAVTFTTTGAGAIMAMIDNTNVAGANLTIEDGANGAVIQVTIQNVVPPQVGPVAFTLSNWQASWNGAGAVAMVVGAASPFTFTTAPPGPINTLDIGATLTNVTGTVYSDQAYPGSFEVSFSY